MSAIMCNLSRPSATAPWTGSTRNRTWRLARARGAPVDSSPQPLPGRGAPSSGVPTPAWETTPSCRAARRRGVDPPVHGPVT